MGLAITLGTGGLGAGSLLAGTIGMGESAIAMGASTALVSTTATQLTLGTINNGGNPLKALEGMTSGDGLTSLTTSMVSGGTLGGLGLSSFGLKPSFTEIVQTSAMRTLVNSGINVAIGRQDIDDVLKNAGVNFVSDVVGTVGANYIGELYQGGRGSIDFTTHKLLHSLLGAGLGALKGDPVAGMLGGMIAETIADLVSDDVEVIAARVQERADQEGIEFGSRAYKDLVYQEVQTSMNWGRLGAAVAVLLAGHDVNVGIDVATNAVENNFAPMVYGAVYVAGLAMTAYDTYQAYEEGGVEGAVESAATDMVMGAVTGGVVKVGAKAVKGAWNGLKKLSVTTAKNKDVGITWGRGIQEQGMPWEDYVAKSLPVDARLPKNFKTFDFYDELTGVATSAKTLNTGSSSMLKDPKNIYKSLKSNIDDAAGFVEYRLSKREVLSDSITLRRLEVAIPKSTTTEQWKQISRAMGYSKNRGVEFNITVVK